MVGSRYLRLFSPGPGADLAINNMGPAFVPTGKPAAYRYIFA